MNQLAFLLMRSHAEVNSSKDSFLHAPIAPVRQERPDYTWYPVTVLVVFVGLLIWGIFFLGKGKNGKKLRRTKNKKKYGRWIDRPY